MDSNSQFSHQLHLYPIRDVQRLYIHASSFNDFHLSTRLLNLIHGYRKVKEMTNFNFNIIVPLQELGRCRCQVVHRPPWAFGEINVHFCRFTPSKKKLIISHKAEFSNFSEFFDLFLTFSSHLVLRCV